MSLVLVAIRLFRIVGRTREAIISVYNRIRGVI